MLGQPSQPSNLKSIATLTFRGEREIACPFSSACLGLCEWTGCPGPDSSSRRVGRRCDSSRCGGSHSVSTQATSPFEGQHSKMLMDTPFLVLQNVYIATFVKLLGWAGRPAPCALRVSNQLGRSYSMVVPRGK